MKRSSKYRIQDFLPLQNHAGTKLILCTKVIFITALSLVMGIFCSCSKREKIPIRIGYSSLTPIHCHIGEVFSHTDILERHRLDATLTSFKRGYEQGEAIKKGKIDAVFGCEVPAVLLVASNSNMKIVAGPGVLGRIAVIAGEDSGIYRMADIRGKKIGLCKGSTAHKDLVFWIQQAGLSSDRDIRIIDIPLEEMEKALAGKLVDAIVTWDPWAEMIIGKGNSRVIHSRLFHSVVAISQGYIDRYPEGAIRYLQALREALYWAAKNKDKTNLWAAEKSGWDLDVVRGVSKLNKNFYDAVEIDDIDIRLSEEHIEALRDCAEFLQQSGAIPKSFDLDESIDTDLVREMNAMQ